MFFSEHPRRRNFRRPLPLYAPHRGLGVHKIWPQSDLKSQRFKSLQRILPQFAEIQPFDRRSGVALLLARLQSQIARCCVVIRAAIPILRLRHLRLCELRGYLCKSLLRPQVTRNRPKLQILLKTRRCPEIPRNSH